jgi:hypothetical protein
MRKLVKIIQKFDKKSKCYFYDTHYNYRNIINFEAINNFSKDNRAEEYINDNYIEHDIETDKKIVELLPKLLSNINDLIDNKILTVENKFIFINTKGCKNYLNVFKTVERKVKEFPFFTGLITGGVILKIVQFVITLL